MAAEMELEESAEELESAEAECDEAGPAGRPKRGPAQRAFVEEVDDAILKAARMIIPKLPKMLESNASNVLALRKAVEAASKNHRAMKDRRNAGKRDERRRRLVEEGPQSLSNVKLEGD